MWAIVWGLKKSSDSVVADEHMGPCGEVSIDVDIAGPVFTNWGSFKHSECPLKEVLLYYTVCAESTVQHEREKKAGFSVVEPRGATPSQSARPGRASEKRYVLRKSPINTLGTLGM